MLNMSVMSQKKCADYCNCPHSEESIIISIRDCGSHHSRWDLPRVSADNGVKAILPLYFDDVDRGELAMAPSDAAKICDFLHKNGVDPVTGQWHHVIVHCEAGMSRSAGVAAAILKYVTGDDSSIFDCPRFRPNMHCYRTVLEYFYKT